MAERIARVKPNYQSKEFRFSPEKFTPSAWVILDLDGVIARWPTHHLPIEQEQASFFADLQNLHKNNVAISVLTNRSPSAMQILAYQLGVDYGAWITESGGSAYSVVDHKGFTLPEWTEFAETTVPECRTFLETNLGIVGRNIPPLSSNEPQFESGMGFVKTVVVPPKGVNPAEYYEGIKPVWTAFSQSNLFKVEAGKALDFDPIGLSKSVGMRHLLSLNGIDPQRTPTLFIADAKRDIDAANTLLEMGGFAGAVGNSSKDFTQAVASHPNGIVAPDTTSYHGSVTNIFQQFTNRL